MTPVLIAAFGGALMHSGEPYWGIMFVVVAYVLLD